MNKSAANYASFVTALCVSLLVGGLASAQDLPQTTDDGLEKVDSKRVDVLYWRPGATFAGYKRVKILEPGVAFKKNWERDQNRDRNLSQRVDAEDMERIRNTLATEFIATSTSWRPMFGAPDARATTSPRPAR
jgi:hypothetical protein